MRSVKGEITVFLSLSFTLLLSFIFGILESAVIQGSKNLSRIDTDRAIYSVFGEYHQELMEQYHVFGIDLGYRTGNYEEENLIQRLHYYNSGSTDHQIKEIQYLTDQSGQAFREQVLAYMEQRYGMDLVKKFTGTTEKWEQTETEESDMEKKTDEMTDAMERVNDSLDASGSQTEGEDVEEGPSLPDEENPFRIMQKIKKEGILSVVIPKGKKVSEKSVDLSGQASKRTLKKGYGTFPTRKGLDQTAEKLLYNEYLLKTFGYAFRQDSEQSEGMDESGEKEWQSDRSDALAYELEYILQGKGSDKENLESVLFRLFLLRMSGNYGCLAKDMGRVAEAEALAVTISALLLMPEAVEALKQMILVAWAGGESVMDLRCLLDGRKVPLVKSADKWVVSLSQLPLLLTDGGSVRGNDSGEGVGYSDYIRMFLFLKSVPEITMRTLDCVEEALHSKHILFQADQCVTKLEIQNSQSLETYYKNKDIRAEEILKLTRQFLSVMEKMKDYMLEPNYLMLSEKYIFEKNENYFFCFFPENEKTWQVSYHELTEYFVRKVDYQDLESIQLVCMLHKETLKETYDLESILQQYEEEAKNREEKSKEEKIREESKREKDRREMEENQNIEVQENSYYNKARENYAVMEEKRYGPIKKFAKRFKSGKWGEWEDLITEADDYE